MKSLCMDHREVIMFPVCRIFVERVDDNEILYGKVNVDIFLTCACFVPSALKLVSHW